MTFQRSSRLRLYVAESDRNFSRPLYEAAMRLAREKGLEGATVTRGLAGYGRASADKILELSRDTPVIVEWVAPRGRLDAFVPELAKLAPGRLVTLEDVEASRL